MDKIYELSNQVEELLSQNTFQNNPASEENILDQFISNFQIDEEEQKLMVIKQLKMLLRTERDNKNEEIYATKKDDMRKKTRVKEKENRDKKGKEKYNMLQQLTEGILEFFTNFSQLLMDI